MKDRGPRGQEGGLEERQPGAGAGRSGRPSRRFAAAAQATYIDANGGVWRRAAEIERDGSRHETEDRALRRYEVLDAVPVWPEWRSHEGRVEKR